LSGDPSEVTTVFAAFFGFACVVLFFAVRTQEERRFLLPLGILAYTLKAIAVPIYYAALVKEGVQGYAVIDSYNYHLDGVEIMGELYRGIDFSSRAWSTVDPAYPILTGIVYWIVGPNTLVMRLLNCVFTSFTLLYVYRLGRMLIDDPRAARWACYLVALLPYSIIISINHIKDPIVTLLATFLILHMLRLIRFEKRWLVSVFFALAGLVAMSFFRSGFVLPFVGILFLCYLTATQSLLRGLLLAVPTLAAIVAVQILISDDASISLQAASERLQEKIATSATLAGTGGLVRLARMTSVFEVYKLPLATFLVVILPFPPILMGALPSVLLSWANLLNIAFLPAMLQGAWAILRGGSWRRQGPLLIASGVFLVLIGASHVGVVRYRETIFPLMLLLAGLGLTRGVNALLYAGVYGGMIALGFVVYLSRFS